MAPCGDGPWPQRPFPSAGGSDRDLPSPCPSGGGSGSRAPPLHLAAAWPSHADGAPPRRQWPRPISPSPTAAAPHLCFTGVVVPASPGPSPTAATPTRLRSPSPWWRRLWVWRITMSTTPSRPMASSTAEGVAKPSKGSFHTWICSDFFEVNHLTRMQLGKPSHTHAACH